MIKSVIKTEISASIFGLLYMNNYIIKTDHIEILTWPAVINKTCN